jgi:tetratricopeptide (TPR) repeat protein
LYSALGYTYEQQKQYKEAIEAYRHAIEMDRDNLDAIRGLAQNLLNDGQADAALEQYKVIADANPEDAQTYVRIAEIYRKQGKFDLALDNLKKAESMVQDSVEVPVQHCRHLPGAGALRRSHSDHARPAEEIGEGGRQVLERRAQQPGGVSGAAGLDLPRSGE